jgi:lipopolysaccharide export system protein LptA
VFSGNAPMGPSTYIIRSNFTYVFRGGSEVNSGTWSLSGNRLTFRRDGGQYQMRISDDGNVLGDTWKRK